jgi:hypothetical protein
VSQPVLTDLDNRHGPILPHNPPQPWSNQPG